MPLEDRVLLVTAYWRTNLTLRQLAPLFGVSKSTAGRVINRLGPLLALQPRKRFAKDTVLIVDGTLVPTRDHTIAEPSKNCRYSTNHQVVPGLNHLAFHINSPHTVDLLTAKAQENGSTLLFPDTHPHAGGPSSTPPTWRTQTTSKSNSSPCEPAWPADARGHSAEPHTADPTSTRCRTPPSRHVAESPARRVYSTGIGRVSFAFWRIEQHA